MLNICIHINNTEIFYVFLLIITLNFTFLFIFFAYIFLLKNLPCTANRENFRTLPLILYSLVISSTSYYTYVKLEQEIFWENSQSQNLLNQLYNLKGIVWKQPMFATSRLLTPRTFAVDTIDLDSRDVTVYW